MQCGLLSVGALFNGERRRAGGRNASDDHVIYHHGSPQNTILRLMHSFILSFLGSMKKYM